MSEITYVFYRTNQPRSRIPAWHAFATGQGKRPNTHSRSLCSKVPAPDSLGWDLSIKGQACTCAPCKARIERAERTAAKRKKHQNDGYPCSPRQPHLCRSCDGRGTEPDYVGLEMRCVEVECSMCGGTGLSK